MLSQEMLPTKMFWMYIPYSHTLLSIFIVPPSSRLYLFIFHDTIEAVYYTDTMQQHRMYFMSFSKVYPLYVAKAEKKSRSKAEVNTIIRWLTGYTQKKLETQLKKQIDFQTFFAEAPKMNPARKLIQGVVCGIRVEEIKEPLVQEIRYLDKLIDELAKGKSMEKILRKK